jgi:hypothetical protein
MVEVINAIGELINRIGVSAFIFISVLAIAGLILWTNWRLNSTVFELTRNVLDLTKNLGEVQGTTIFANTSAMNVNTAAIREQSLAIKEQSEYLKKMGGSDPTGMCKVNDNIEKIKKIIVENGYKCPSENILKTIVDRLGKETQIAQG